MLVFYKISMDSDDVAQKLPRVLFQSHTIFYSLPNHMCPFLVGLETRLSNDLEGYSAKLFLPLEHDDIERIHNLVN